jgi:serine protease Do
VATRNPKKDATPDERVERGVVAVERAGQVVGLGAALAGDGRILTALSPLGSGNGLDARFSDGTVVHVKVGHHDRTWDLALLVPQAGKWQQGLLASSRDPFRADATIQVFSVNRNKVMSLPIVLRARRALIGGDDKPIESAIDIGSRVSSTDLGSPLVDEEGHVVAVLGRACAPNDGRPCTPVAFGIPMAAIRSFLRSVPPTAVSPSPWLGIQGVSEMAGVAKGVRIVSVAPQSPAEEAHLTAGDHADGDIILAVDGTPVTTAEALADTIRAHGVGDRVPLLLLRNGRYREISVILRAAPDGRATPPPAVNPAELPPASEALPKPVGLVRKGAATSR